VEPKKIAGSLRFSGTESNEFSGCQRLIEVGNISNFAA
jgi:hypothetical protein